jgi:Ser/Thr protein kinase RdoA (MazF antagonist)
MTIFSSSDCADQLGARLSEGREAQVYARDADTVVKLYRPGFTGHRSESLALAALDGYTVAPRLIGTVHCGGRVGLVLERLAGSDMLALLQRQPWRVFSLARMMAAAHLAVHNVLAPPQLPDLRAVLAARIRNADLPGSLEAFALNVLDGLPAGDRLCHGDYHPANVLVDGDRTQVIDWTAATRGVPQADYARTIVLLRWAEPLPGTPLATRLLLATGRTAFTRAYARAHRHGASDASHQVEQWLTVHAAARLSEGIAAERTGLTRYLEHLRRAHSRRP